MECTICCRHALESTHIDKLVCSLAGTFQIARVDGIEMYVCKCSRECLCLCYAGGCEGRVLVSGPESGMNGQ